MTDLKKIMNDLEKTIKDAAQPAISWDPAKEKRLSKIGGLPDVKQGFV